jgi:hypothetical protein
MGIWADLKRIYRTGEIKNIIYKLCIAFPWGSSSSFTSFIYITFTLRGIHTEFYFLHTAYE